MYQTIGLVILGLLFICVISIYNSRRSEGHLIKGFWSGSADFCSTANLDLFLMYIGDGSFERPGYILMKNADGFIINNPVRLYVSGGYSATPSISECIKYSVEIDWLDDEGFDFFPKQQTIHYYPCVGKMIWSNGDTIHAITYKNNQISDVGQSIPEDIAELNDTEQEEYNGGESI